MRFWRDISISKKLYFVVGTMAFLIAGELLTIRFAMDKLSAVRAFVEGEGLWSKAQKDAALSLQRYGETLDESDYQEFLRQLEVNAGDHHARTELEKPNPDLQIVRDGFIEGKIHPDDIPAVINLLRRFNQISYIHRALEIWVAADLLLDEFRDAGNELHLSLASNPRDRKKAAEALNHIRLINKKLTNLEQDFSSTLGSGSRWLEGIVLSGLLVAVLLVESIGLSLTFLTSRRISKGLRELNEAARKIGQGEFSHSFGTHAQDEIGTLMKSIHQTGLLLEASYQDLEKRVADRTHDLKVALKSRDEFLSIASHELKTPLTALFLELQLIARSLRSGAQDQQASVAAKADLATRQARKMANLVDDLLDLTRIQAGKLELHLDRCDLRALIEDAIASLKKMAERKGSTLCFASGPPIIGYYDSARMGQVVTNLISNAIKYGEGKPIELQLTESEKSAQFSVRDQGRGIPEKMQSKIFERFERAVDGSEISGLGLGLFIAREIVLAHGGEITVASEEGKGSRFVVDLPLSC